jgi:glutamyl-tRNA synthetase
MASEKNMATGRLAPSPTGAQHPGNARTFLVAWLAARSTGSRLILRIEDLDSPRVKPWAMTQAVEDLAWLGLDWDEGPNTQPSASEPNSAKTQNWLDDPAWNGFVQSRRLARYAEIFHALQQGEWIYPCTCSRADVSQAASAPHQGHEPAIYPGTCRHRQVADADQLADGSYCWRFRTAGFTKPMGWEDRIAGEQSAILPHALGDFVIAKADGTPAYQLAVVVDDHDMEVREVVRGDDLIPSTYRQLALYQVLGWTAPEFAHVPLVKGPDGLRLAKRHGDSRLSILREAGVDSRVVMGWLACSLGLRENDAPISPAELIAHFAWDKIPTRPVNFPRNVWDEWMRG